MCFSFHTEVYCSIVWVQYAIAGDQRAGVIHYFLLYMCRLYKTYRYVFLLIQNSFENAAMIHFTRQDQELLFHDQESRRC